MSDRRGEVLVAILNNLLDFAVAREQHWYRIPVNSVERLLKDRWPPEFLAFYHTRVFGDEAFGVHYFARVLHIDRAYRWQLLPDQPRDERSRREYFKLSIGALQPLAHPIWSRRLRRIVFIPTTWDKLMNAAEINDLYDESPLEDRLWAELKRLQIEAERQEFVSIDRRNYFLDFAVYCMAGKLNVETDGDTWHSDRERIPLDNVRDNDLKTAGWDVLRFDTRAIRERMAEYCVPTIAKNVNRLGGVDVRSLATGRVIGTQAPSGERQLGLFDIE